MMNEKNKESYIKPETELIVVGCARICAVSTGTDDVFSKGNEPEEEDPWLPKQDNLWD